MHNRRLRVTWYHMLDRCNCPKRESYPRYGGRGITVCDEWLDYKKFEEWAISAGYRDDLTLDRIDNDGDYCPENCRWATVKQQANNRSTNVFIEYQGEIKTIAEWAEQAGIQTGTLWRRITEFGWDMEKALNTPIMNGGYTDNPVMLTLGDKTQSVNAWSRETGMSTQAIRRRIKGGWSDEEILTRPLRKRRTKAEMQAAACDSNN